MLFKPLEYGSSHPGVPKGVVLQKILSQPQIKNASLVVVQRVALIYICKCLPQLFSPTKPDKDFSDDSKGTFTVEFSTPNEIAERNKTIPPIPQHFREVLRKELQDEIAGRKSAAHLAGLRSSNNATNLKKRTITSPDLSTPPPKKQKREHNNHYDNNSNISKTSTVVLESGFSGQMPNIGDSNIKLPIMSNLRSSSNNNVNSSNVFLKTSSNSTPTPNSQTEESSSGTPSPESSNSPSTQKKDQIPPSDTSSSSQKLRPISPKPASPVSPKSPNQQQQTQTVKKPESESSQADSPSKNATTQQTGAPPSDTASSSQKLHPISPKPTSTQQAGSNKGQLPLASSSNSTPTSPTAQPSTNGEGKPNPSPLTPILLKQFSTAKAPNQEQNQKKNRSILSKSASAFSNRPIQVEEDAAEQKKALQAKNGSVDDPMVIETDVPNSTSNLTPPRSKIPASQSVNLSDCSLNQQVLLLKAAVTDMQQQILHLESMFRRREQMRQMELCNMSTEINVLNGKIEARM